MRGLVPKPCAGLVRGLVPKPCAGLVRLSVLRGMWPCAEALCATRPSLVTKPCGAQDREQYFY